MQDKKGYGNDNMTQKQQHGSIRIADDVVAMIAGIAALEVDGVTSMAGNIASELFSAVGVSKATKGVRVEVIDKNVNVEVAVVVDYGYSIPMTSQKVQQRVKTAIANMTGLHVVGVNVRIAGVSSMHQK